MAAKKVAYLLKAHFVHDALGGHDVLVCGPDELHGQGNRPVGGIKVEQPRLGDTQEGRHVLVVGERCRQAHNADHALAGLNLHHMQCLGFRVLNLI